jgi:PAS domain S-box-containing protein
MKTTVARRPKMFAQVAATAVFVAGMVVLGGWWFDLPNLKSILSVWPKMSPATALAFILSSLSLWCAISTRGEKTLLSRASQIFAVLVTLLGSLKLGDYVLGWNLDFDALGFHETINAVNFQPAHVSPMTALDFFLIGSALLLVNRSRLFGLFQSLTLLAGLVGWLGFARYLYGGAALMPFGAMAMHTAVCFLLLSMGILCTRTDDGLMALIISNSAGGLLARRLLPPAILIPIAFGWLRLKAQHAGWFGTEAGLSLFAFSNVVVFGALIWITAKLLHHTDSKRQQMENELKMSAREVLDLKTALDEHAIVAITNPQGKITYVNDKFCNISKFSRKQLLGQDHRVINSGHHSKDFIRNLWTTIARGQVWHGEIKNRAKDGSFYWVDTTIVPFLDEHGKPRQYVAIRADITARKEAELASTRLAAIVEYSDDSIISKDLNSVIMSWNKGAEQTFGYTADEMIGTSIMRLIPDGRKAEENYIMGKIKNGESVKHFETLRQTKDGRLIDVSITVSSIKDAAGKIIGVSKVARDITERKQAEAKIRELNTELEQRVIERTAQLEAANRELEAFSYSVSHDLRAPLRAVNGFAGIVLEDFSPQLPEEGRRYLERIRAGGQQMGELIDDLLAFSRLSRQPVNRQPVDTVHLVQNTLDELKPQQNGRQIELRIGKLPACHGDPALLKQVWINLISNAIKYTRGHEPAIIEIGCECENDEPIFFVRDNGAGFDMQYANKLFGVFQRLHRADEFEGTGVGLAIVQRIIHRHGGRVWAQAEVNRGATFHFTLEGENKKYERNK